MASKVRRENGKVWIEGVEQLTWKTWNTFIGSLAATARSMGDDISYQELMGRSGAAFKLSFHQPEWCPSSPDAGLGFDCTSLACRSLGYRTEHLHWDKDNPETETAMRKAVVESIEREAPVLAIDLILVPDYGVIAGYVEDGGKYLCRTFHKLSDKYDENEKMPWWVLIVTERHDPPARRHIILDSFKAALTMSRTERFGKYASGFAAYEAWAKDLENDAFFPNDEKQAKVGSHAHVNGWVYHSLVDARRAAVTYLRSAAEAFEGELRVLILKTADLYNEVVNALMPVDQYALHLGHLSNGREWTRDMRLAEAKALREASRIERQAIDQIEQAVNAIEA